MKNKRLIAKIMKGDTISMTIDGNLVSAEFGALDRGSLTPVADWGIYVNRGSLSFVDITGFFNNQNTNSPSILGYIVKFYLAYGDKESLIGTFKVKSATVDEETRIVSIECASKLEDLQRTMLAEYYPFNATDLHSIRIYGVPGIQASTDAIAKLVNSNIYCPYFPQETSWNRLNKICQASMCRVFDDENGNAIMSGAFPTRTPIVVKPSDIIDILDSAFVRTPNLSIKVTEREKRLGTDNNIIENVSDQFTLEYQENGYPIYDARTDANISGGTFYFYPLSGDANLYVDFSKTTSIPYKVKDNARAKIYVSIEPNSDPSTEYIGGSTYIIAPTTIEIESPSEIYYKRIKATAVDAIDSAWITHIKFIRVEFYGDHFRDISTKTEQTISDANEDVVAITSNDLIQTKSYYGSSTIKLADYILTEVSRRYGQGIECFEIECLFNDYYYEDGTSAFDGGDLSTRFKKYDVIIPYVKRQGKTVPLRQNEDGTPKKFRIIGISYLYDGLLRQKLQVQEERYDID